MQGVGGFGGKGGGGGVRLACSPAASNFAVLVGCEMLGGVFTLSSTRFFNCVLCYGLQGWVAGVFCAFEYLFMCLLMFDKKV